MEKTTNFLEIIPELIDILTNKIKLYHELFDTPLIAELWEEVLHKSIEELGYKTTWKPNRSHKVGEDMRICGIPNSRISCKSGQFIKPKSLKKLCVKWNGSRTTKIPWENLNEKISLLSESHDDWIILLAKNKPFKKVYNLLIVNSNDTKVNLLDWKEKTEKTYEGSNKNFIASISKSMSHQLWTTYPCDLINYKYTITI